MVSDEPPVRRRSKNRKAEIAAAAAELFARSGYAAVSVDDIGAQVGITGPALYRHYAGKQAVITEVLDRTMEALGTAARPIEGEADDLRSIVERTTSVAMAMPAAFTIWLHDARHHDPTTLDAFRSARRIAGAHWHRAELAVNPALTNRELRVREEAIVAVIQALTRARGTTRGDTARLAGDLAIAIVETAPPAPAKAAPAQKSRPWVAAPSRRDHVLAVAVPMFRERGFAGVSMDEIGEAAGITGPTVYRYYESKAAILIDAFDRTDTRLAVAVEQALAASTSADHALGLLIRAYVDVAFASADLIAVTSREAEALPTDERARQTRRARANSEHWIAVLSAANPSLDDAEVRLLLRAMFALVNHLVQLKDGPSVEVIAALAAAVAQPPQQHRASR